MMLNVECFLTFCVENSPIDQEKKKMWSWFFYSSLQIKVEKNLNEFTMSCENNLRSSDDLSMQTEILNY